MASSNNPNGEDLETKRHRKEASSVEEEEEKSSEDQEDKLSVHELAMVLTSESVDGDEDFMWDMLESTKTSAIEKLQAAEEALGAQNWDSVSRYCHTIKGSALMLRLDKLGQAAADGEKLFKTISTADDQLQLRQDVFAKFKYEITRLVGTKRSLTKPS